MAITLPYVFTAATQYDRLFPPQVYADLLALSINGRTRLTANTTYYIAPLPLGADVVGNGSITSPYLTFAFAFAQFRSLIDTAGFTVTFQFADGTYAGFATLNAWTGGGSLIIQGNTSDKNLVIFSGAIGVNTGGNYVGAVTVRFIKFTGAGGVSIDMLNGGGLLFYNNVNFAGLATFHVRGAYPGGVVTANGAYEISAGAGSSHWNVDQGGVLSSTGAFTITVTGVPNFVTAFAYAINRGLIGPVGSLTFSPAVGAATCPRYSVDTNCTIQTNGGGAAYFPGSTPGVGAGFYN